MSNMLHDRTYLFNVKGVNIIGNGDNGAIIGLDDEGLNFIDKIKQGKLGECSLSEEEQQIMTALNEFGYFTRSSGNLDTAYLHVTDRCNLSCVGCYSFIENRNSQKDLSTEELLSIVDQLAECGVQGITISGGEPFLRTDMPQILERIKKHNMYAAAITNGTMDWDRVKDALPYLDVLNVSVDGYNRETRFIRNDGIMDKVLDFVEHFKDLIPVNLVFTLHKKNVEYMKEYIHLANELNVSSNFSIFSVDPYDETFSGFVLDESDLGRIAKFVNDVEGVYIEDSVINGQSDGLEGLRCKVGCGLGCGIVSVAANGDVFPCHMLHKEEMKLGSLKTDSLKNILKSKEAKWSGITVDDISDCSDCEYKYMCGGGCRGRSYLYHKALEHKDPFCTLTKLYLNKRTKIFEQIAQQA